MDSDIFHYMTKGFRPRVRWERVIGADSLDDLLTHEFVIRIQAWWKSRPTGLGLVESKIGDHWVPGSAPLGKY